MEAVQIVRDKMLLLAADRGGRRTNRTRSAFMQDALPEDFQRLERKDREARGRTG